jgi:hypothetical protein
VSSLLALAFSLGGCAPRGLGHAVATAGELDVPANLPGLANNPQLRARLLGSPHAYYRFINAGFSRAVCSFVRDVLGPQPPVTLHGDAHVEQYAITDLGRGLTDFDDSSEGPAAMDLLRFAVSLRLAAMERGWGTAGEVADAAFERGYRDALADPSLEAPEPALAVRVRAGFEHDRAVCLDRTEALIENLEDRPPVSDEATMAQAVQTLAQNSRLPEAFFRKKKGGALKLGIGSALDEKYLVRIEGPTDAPDDDVILEVKQVREPAGVDCVRSSRGPSRIFVGGARIAYEPFRFPGIFHVGEKTFWIHAWPDNYVELSILKNVESPRDLDEVAYDVGVQLGRGHPGGLGEEAAARLRSALLKSVPDSRLDAAAAVLTRDTLAAWERFRSAPGPAS